MSKVLCVLTSHGVKGVTGEQTGFWLSELTHPLEKCITQVLRQSLLQ